MIHETTAVYIAVNASYAACSRILPHHEWGFVAKLRYLLGISGDHVIIMCKRSAEIFIVEIARAVEDRSHAIVAFHHLDEGLQVLLELL